MARHASSLGSMWRIFIAVISIGIATLPVARPAMADHPELLSAAPAAGASLESAPPDVILTFNALLEAAESTLVVADASGTVVNDGPAQLVPTNNKMIRATLLPDLAPGDYSVTWSIVSAESGTAAKGSSTFSIAPSAATPSDDAANVRDEASTSDSDGTE